MRGSWQQSRGWLEGFAVVVQLETVVHFRRPVCSLYKIRDFPLICLCKNSPGLSTVAPFSE